MSREEGTVTPERAAKGKIVMAARTAHAGGNVASMGQHDAWHSYTDFLHDRGLLGPTEGTNPAGNWRRDAADDFLKLYYRTHRSERSNVLSVVKGGDAGEGYVSLDDATSDAARFEQEWLLASKYLIKHFRVLQDFVLNGMPPANPCSLADVNDLPEVEAERKVNRWLMQRSTVKAHITAIELGNMKQLLWAALDAVPEAMKRAHDEAWK